MFSFLCWNSEIVAVSVRSVASSSGVKEGLGFLINKMHTYVLAFKTACFSSGIQLQSLPFLLLREYLHNRAVPVLLIAKCS